MDLPAHFTEAKTETSESRDFRTRTANGGPRAHPERGLGVGGARRPEPQGLGVGGRGIRNPRAWASEGRGVRNPGVWASGDVASRRPRCATARKPLV